MPCPRLPLLLCLALALPVLADQSPPATPDTPSSTSPAPSERAPLSERTVLEATALERQLPQREQQQLSAGEEKVLALWRPANVDAPKGVVVLLPGDDESADAPAAIGPLRRKLPDAGWHSLSIALPDADGDTPPLRAAAAGDAATPPADSPPASADAAKNAEAEKATAEAEKRRTAHAERVMARIDAALAFAKQQQAKTIVLLGHGSGGYWAGRYLSERKPTDVRNLLLVAVQLPAGFTPPLDELIPPLKLATGDFYYRESGEDTAAALQRLQASKRLAHPAYVQVGLDALPDNDDEQERLFRRIRGWLDKHGASAPGAR